MSTEGCVEGENLIEVTDSDDETAKGWYYYADNDKPDDPERYEWIGPFATCRDALTAMIAYPKGFPRNDA